MRALPIADPEIFELVQAETRRQRDSLRLIPSENYASAAVLEASGSILTNKYSEGYPGRRYYEGQEYIDAIERLAIARVKALFGAEHVNVQPYSGSPANLAVYIALAEPGDRVMGLALPMGGHLTHGWKVNFSGKLFEAHQYEVDPETERFDMAAIRRQALEVKPKIIFAGTTAYPRKIEFDKFREVADEVGAYLVADIAHISGLVVGGVHQSPVPYADVVTSTTHKTFRGPRGGMILCREAHRKAIDRAVFPGLQGGPHNHVTAGIAVAAKEAATPAFKAYTETVVADAAALAEGLKAEGFRLVTGGTDNHLILLDLTPMGVLGKPAAQALARAGIVCNYNTIPFDKNKPFNPSGLRLGTPAMATRGLTPEHMPRVAQWMGEVVRKLDDEATIARIGREVTGFLTDFPAPGIDDV